MTLARYSEKCNAKMEIPVTYRKMKSGDEDPVSTFIAEVFYQFVAPQFSQSGIEEFMTYIQPEALAKHLKSNHFGLIASAGSKIIGAIVVRDYNHVALFFVGFRHQRKGIGKKLFKNALEICIGNDVNTPRITVNASPNSIETYKKLNFDITDTEQCVNGIRFVPMALQL